MERIEATVWGRVQGVSFRYYTSIAARELGLKGWVRNLPDGSVSVVAEGCRPALEEFLVFLRRGSRAAKVDRLDLQWLPARYDSAEFRIRR